MILLCLTLFILLSRDGTANARAFEATVAFGHLLQVVIVLSVVKQLAPQDLCANWDKAIYIQLL